MIKRILPNYGTLNMFYLATKQELNKLDLTYKKTRFGHPSRFSVPVSLIFFEYNGECAIQFKWKQKEISCHLKFPLQTQATEYIPAPQEFQIPRLIKEGNGYFVTGIFVHDEGKWLVKAQFKGVIPAGYHYLIQP